MFHNNEKNSLLFEKLYFFLIAQFINYKKICNIII